MSEQDAIPAGKLAAAFLRIRDARAELKAEYETKDKALEQQMDVLESEMLEKCKAEDADSIKTQHGTIMRSVKQRFWPADWDAFKTFCRENDALDLFEKRVHQTNVTQWLEEHKDNPPPGLNIDRRYSCTVRKSK